MDRESLKIHFESKAKYHKLMFDKTMPKYLEQYCDFDVPIMIRRLIGNYYELYTVKKVQNMEFNLLKRFVEFTNSKYSQYSLTVMMMLFNRCINGEEVLQRCIDYGLFVRIKQLLSLNKTHIIDDCLSFFLATDVYINNFFEAGITQITHLIASNYAKNKRSAYLAISVLFEVLLQSNYEQRVSMHQQGIVKNLFKNLCAVIDEIALKESDWETIRFVVEKLCRDHFQSKAIDEMPEIKQYFEKYDKSKIKQENKRKFEDLLILIRHRIL